MKQQDIRNLPVEQEYASLGPVSASASPDLQTVALDFVNTTHTATLRLVFPATALGKAIAALQHAEQLLANPAGPLRHAHLEPKH